MISENPANREHTRHVDTRVHYLRELVRDGHVKLLKYAGPQNVAYALTKSLPLPNIGNICGAHVFLFQLFISLSRLDGHRHRPAISSHDADIKSHTTPEKCTHTSVCALVRMCVRVCVQCRYDLRCHVRHRRRAK
jgi:hypothetical protein